MNRCKRSLVSVAAALVLGSALDACVVVPAEPAYYGGAPVLVAPPAPQAEVFGVAPGPGYFWIGGYWNWYGGRYAWYPGRWEAQRAGYRWVPHQWYRDGAGWRARPGHWQPH